MTFSTTTETAAELDRREVPERLLLTAVLADPALVAKATAEGIRPEVFRHYADLWAAVAELGEATCAATLSMLCRDRGALIDAMAAQAMGTASAAHALNRASREILEVHRQDKVRNLALRAAELAGQSPDEALALLRAEVGKVECGDRRSERDERLERILDQLRFNLATPPPPARPLFELAGKVILTPGNLGALVAQAKAGKTAKVGAMLAATMGTGETLGVTSTNPDGAAVLHFDSEQSPQDHFAVVRTALRRVNLDTPPPWLRSYSLLAVPCAQRFDLIEDEMARTAEMFGALHSVLVDGVGDLVLDPNDPEEAFAAVERLHRLAARHDCGIWGVLHLNPASETKSRGHLGSQLERKAETTLMLRKDSDGVTTVYAEKARHCHIPQGAGPRFRWSDEAGMHVAVAGTAGEERRAAKARELRAIAEEAFGGESVLRWSELVKAVHRVINRAGKEKSERTAENRVAEMHQNGVLVRKSLGFWGLA